MRYFAYIGDHEVVTSHGVTFLQGEPTPVKDPKLIKKLEGNSHWRETEPLPDLPPVDVEPHAERHAHRKGRR